MTKNMMRFILLAILATLLLSNAASAQVKGRANNYFNSVASMNAYAVNDNTSELMVVTSATIEPGVYVWDRLNDEYVAVLRKTADSIFITDAGGYFVSGDVEGALQELGDKVGDLNTLTGVAAGAQHLGTFTGSIIPDNVTIKAALQALESNGGGTISTNFTITGDGSPGSPVQFINDEAFPGNSQYYGTNGAGTKGWYDLPAGSIVSTGMSITGDGDATDITLVNDEASPGADRYYGTNGAGTKGWYLSSEAGGGGGTPVKDTVYVVGEALIKASGVGVGYSRTTNTATLTIPDGVTLSYVRVNLATANMGGNSDFILNITDNNDWANLGDVTTWMPPVTSFYKRDNLGNDPPTNTFAFQSTQDNPPTSQLHTTGYGSSTIEMRWRNVDSYANWSVVVVY